MDASAEAAYELAFPHVIEGIAQGASRTEVLGWLGRVYPAVTRAKRDRELLLRDALDDALSCGIEREDVDPSWFK